MNAISLFCLFLPLTTIDPGPSAWLLKDQSDGITVSSRHSQLSKFNDIRVEMDLPGTVAQLASILLDVGSYPRWAYSTKSSSLVKKVDDTEIIYYSEVSAPWPLSNRDFYADVKISCDSNMYSMCLISRGLKDFQPEKKGLVRIPSSKAVWNITQKSDKVIHLDYILQVDPGGCLPAWIANLFATKGPKETFSNLRKKMEALNR